MSDIEELLSRGIAAVKEGVVVTDSELVEAREVLDETIETRRRRRRTVAAVAVAAVVLPVAGVAAALTVGGEDDAADPAANVSEPEHGWLEGGPPAPELLEGLWRVDNGTLLVRFSAPDVVTFDDGGRLYGDPAVTGTYELEGDLITVTADGGAAGCAGQTFSMRASLPAAGAMRFVHEEPGVENCFVPQGDLWALEQVLPSSDALVGLRAPGARADWRPPAGEQVLHGAWMAVGGGHVLELDPGGAYYVAGDTGAPIERGEWTLDGDTLRFTVASSGDGCREGDQVVLDGVQHIGEPATDFLRSASADTTCNAAWAGEEWVLLPDEGS